MWWNVFEIVLDTCFLFVLFMCVKLGLLPTTFNVQHHSMSQILPFDIIALIIDIAGENKDPNLFKLLNRPSSITDADSIHHLASSKKAFVTVKLLKGGRTFSTIISTNQFIVTTRPWRSSALTHPFKYPPNNILVSTASQSPLRVGTGIQSSLPLTTPFLLFSFNYCQWPLVLRKFPTV